MGFDMIALCAVIITFAIVVKVSNGYDKPVEIVPTVTERRPVTAGFFDIKTGELVEIDTKSRKEVIV